MWHTSRGYHSHWQAFTISSTYQQLKKCLMAPVDVVLPEVAPLETDLMYPECPIKILDQQNRVTRRKTIRFFKIQWSNHTIEEAIWESKDFLRSYHPDLELPSRGNVRLFAVPLGSFLFQISGRYFLGERL
jgi:hypothetical protein